MDIFSASVNSHSAGESVAEMRRRIGRFPVAQLVFFASFSYDFPELARLMQEAFPQARTMGCTSYAELGNGGIGRGTISALAFAENALLNFAAAPATDLSRDAGSVEKALAAMETQLGCKLLDLDYRRHFGLSLFDGRSPNIERAMELVASKTDFTFIGGFASDDFSLGSIAASLDGVAYQDCAVLAVVEPAGKFTLLKTQSHEPVGPVYTATKVDEANKLVIELDGRSARSEFARGIGIDEEQLTEDYFLAFSLGIMAEGEPFIRAGAKILPDGAIKFFCTVREGQRLALMRVGDQVAQTRKALEKAASAIGGIGAILDFDCAHRDMYLQAEGKAAEYTALFHGAQMAGFATFGELFMANVNQTAVMALFE
ncbi:MAG: FIST C-terminal domain-containing protein [Planctomycetota bacterium]|jgi:hypothetical protein|nr:FIST C-terminal domain-containing protein [Planctomycetota bacterium]